MHCQRRGHSLNMVLPSGRVRDHHASLFHVLAAGLRMTPELEAKQHRIAALGGPIRPIAGNLPIAATTAIKITRALISAGPSNQIAPFSGGSWGGQVPGGPRGLRSFDRPEKKRDDPFAIRRLGAELDRWMTSTIATSDVDTGVGELDYDEAYAMTLSNLDPYRIDHVDEIAHLAIRHAAGNCGYIASTAFALMRHAGVAPLDLILILPRSGPRFFRNHTVAVLGIPDVSGNQKEPPFDQWADTAVLADAWQEEVSMPASVLADRWPRDTYHYLSYARVRPRS